MLCKLVEQAVAAAIATGSVRMGDDAELSLLFTGDGAMRRLNRQWRGIDRATNVLSFPGGDLRPGEHAGGMLGDIVLAYETITAEASLDGKTLDHHLSHLVIHGFLHLLGYDHLTSDEAQAMEDIERRALALLGIGDPYRGGV